MGRRISDDQVLVNAQTVEAMIKTFDDDRRAAMTHLFDEIGQEFFAAPASGREEYHNCWPGGLCDHTLRVIKNLTLITAQMGLGRWPREQLRFVGLVHDLGKAGDGDRPYYVPNPNEWSRNRGMLYEVNRELPFMPVVDRTLFVLQKFGVALTDEEYLAIRLSDGLYEETNKRYAMKEPDLALLLHWADRWATAEEK